MSEEVVPVAAPQPAEAAGGTGAEAAAQSPGPEPETFSLEYVQKLRQEAAQHRVRATAAEGRVTQFEEANKTEAQRAADRLKALEDENNTLKAARLQDAREKSLTRAVGETNALYPDLIVAKISEALVPSDPKTGEPDPAALKAALTQLQKSYPALFGAGALGGDAGAARNTQGARADMNTLLRS